MNDDWQLYQENGLMENLQALCLFIAALLFVFAAFTLTSANRYVMCMFATISVALMLRELNVEDFDLPEVIIFLGAGKGRSFLLLPLLISWFFMFKQRGYYSHHFSLYIRTPFAIYGILAFVAVLCSEPFDKKMIMIEHRMFFEEMFELAGYYLYAIAALLATPSLSRLSAQIEKA
jgi:hypothetical protein